MDCQALFGGFKIGVSLALYDGRVQNLMSSLQKIQVLLNSGQLSSGGIYIISLLR